MKQGTTRVLVVVAAGLGLILSLVFVGIWREKRAVRLFKAELIARGEKLKVNDLIPPFSAGAHQAAIELTDAASRLPNNSPTVSLNPPRKMRFVAPGRAVVGWQVPDLRQEEWLTNRWEDLDAELAAAEPVLREIRGVLKSPSFNWDLAYGQQGFSLMMPHLAKIKQIVQWLATATMNDLHAGRLDLALANHAALLQAVNSLQDEPLLISQLVRVACAATAFTATWEAVQANGWTDQQLRQIQTAWETVRFTRSLDRSIEMSRSMNVEVFARCRQSHIEIHRHLAPLEPPVSARRVASGRPRWINEIAAFWTDSAQRLRMAGRAHLWQCLWSYFDEYQYLQKIETTLKSVREAEASGSLAGINLPVDEDLESLHRPDAGPARLLFSTRFLASLDMNLRRVRRIETQRELVVTAVALKRFWLQHDRWPADLNALVPEFLGQPPIDPMDGQTLRYRLNSDGSFTLYSVNADGKDDTGDPVPPMDRAKSHDFSHGRDLVWPTPASVEEEVNKLR